MKFSIVVAGSPAGCPATAIKDSTHEVDLSCGVHYPRPGEPGENYQCGCSCYSWQSGVSCDHDKCNFGKIISVNFLHPMPSGIGTKNEVLLKDDLCPKCGWPVACVYWENGAGNTFTDNFMHQCTNPDCGHILAGPSEEFGGENNEEHDWPNCPFCLRASVQ